MLSFPLVILSDYHSDIGGAFFLGPCALSFQAAVLLMICWIVSICQHSPAVRPSMSKDG